jgi:hypothetical protein
VIEMILSISEGRQTNKNDLNHTSNTKIHSSCFKYLKVKSKLQNYYKEILKVCLSDFGIEKDFLSKNIIGRTHKEKLTNWMQISV